MTSTRLWDRAAGPLVPADGRNGRRRAEIVALPARGLPSVEELFAFMRDAELRFETLRIRIEERTFTTRGEHLVAMDIALRHPGHARVTTTEPGTGTAGNYEIWVSDGAVVRTYSGSHRLGTERPVRPPVRGLADPDFPGFARVYEPLTALPMETLPDTFVHPAGYAQNVLATGRCWISGTDVVAGREAIVLECDHPRAVELVADRPDFHVQIGVDRGDGVILRLVETIGGDVTRHAQVVAYDADVRLPHTTFEYEFPEQTTVLY